MQKGCQRWHEGRTVERRLRLHELLVQVLRSLLQRRQHTLQRGDVAFAQQTLEVGAQAADADAAQAAAAAEAAVGSAAEDGVNVLREESKASALRQNRRAETRSIESEQSSKKRDWMSN